MRKTKAEMQAIIDELLLNGERERRKNDTFNDLLKRYEEKCAAMGSRITSLTRQMEEDGLVIEAERNKCHELQGALNSLRNDNESLKREKHKFELKTMRLTAQVRGLLVALRTMVQTLIEEKDLSA